MFRCNARSILALAFWTLRCGVATADSVPGGVAGPYVYYSTDMTPIDVLLGQVWYRTDDEFGIGTIDPNTYAFIPQEPIIRAKLPRAYINIAEPYSQNATHPELRHEVLPDRILSSYVTITLTYPESQPYSVVYGTWTKYKPDLTLPGLGVGITGWPGKEKQMRAMYIQATIRPVVQNARKLDLIFKPDKYTPKAGDYEGFSFHTSRPSNWEYYFDDGPDEIRRISCTAPVAKSRPNFFCEYTLPLNTRLYANVKFLDFRFHGGREFARERIRAFKKFACPIFQCDEKALKAAEVSDPTK